MPTHDQTAPSPVHESGFLDEITLGVLATVESDANVSQRDMARKLGVALGLANSYLKRCVRKGYIKVQQVPRRRYAYYLTPQGFAEKARLTGEYLSSSLRFFRQSRDQIGALLDECSKRGWKTVALIGISELAEIATLCAHDVDIEISGIVETNTDRASFSGLPVVDRLERIKAVDAVIVTAMRHGESMMSAHCVGMDPERVLIPRVLRLARPQAKPVAEPVL